MTLSERLAARQHHATRSNKGCATCAWLATRTEQERNDFNAWLDNNLSAAPLHEECVAEGLNVGLSAFRLHIRDRKQERHVVK